jgi:hypothetical protein
MPVEYRVTYEDGTTELRTLPVEVWYSTNQWTVAWDADGKKIKMVEVDPEGVLPDTDLSNNKWEMK